MVSPIVVLWSRAGGVCCVEGLLVHSLRSAMQLLEGGFPVRRGAGAARPQPRNCRRAATQGSQARQLNVCCAGNRGDVRCGWAADDPAAGGGAAQIVGEERRKTRGFFLKYEDPGRLRVDLNPLRTVERKLESKRRKSRSPECLGMSRSVSNFERKLESKRKIQDPGTSRNVSGFRPFFRLAFK